MTAQVLILIGTMPAESSSGWGAKHLPSVVLFGLAYLLDLAIGDPRWLPHPVRIMGSAIRQGETLLRRLNRSDAGQFIEGMFLTIAVAGISGVGCLLLLSFTEGLSGSITSVLIVYLASTSMATRSLIHEVYVVKRSLLAHNVELARTQVSRIVGRDTGGLDEPEIIRAAVETLAESASDGIVAPMLYLAIGGVPAAIAYKAVNTLDSMIGHNDSRYEYFGKFAARLDDLVNFVPARLTAVLIAIAAFLSRKQALGAWRIWLRDGAKHASPNAGQVEAAMAGALGVRLGGLNYYGGEPYFGAYLGDSRESLTVKNLNGAIVIVALVSFLMCFLVSIWLIYWNGRLF